VALREQVSGAGHADTLRALNGLAATLFARARFGEAAETFARALEGQRLALGDSHPDTIRLKNNLAAAYLELGRYLEAEELQREVVEERTRVLGGEHPMTTLSRNNLGITLLFLGRYAEAEQTLRETLTLRSAAGSTAGRLHTQSFLARLYHETGRLEEAEDLYESTLAEQRESEGGEADALRSAVGLAMVYRELGVSGRAEGLLREQLSLQMEAGREDHPDTVGVRTTLSELLLSVGDLEGAREQIEKALQSELEANSPVRESAEVQQLRVQLALGETDGVVPRLREILASRARRVGSQTPASLEIEEILALASPESALN
jgi:tetratricopeptide (TPR) repeat protein